MTSIRRRSTVFFGSNPLLHDATLNNEDNQENMLESFENGTAVGYFMLCHDKFPAPHITVVRPQNNITVSDVPHVDNEYGDNIHSLMIKMKQSIELLHQKKEMEEEEKSPPLAITPKRKRQQEEEEEEDTDEGTRDDIPCDDEKMCPKCKNMKKPSQFIRRVKRKNLNGDPVVHESKMTNCNTCRKSDPLIFIK